MRASVDNAVASAGLGINVNRVFGVTFALGSGLAGLGGGLGIDVLGLDPTFPLKYMVYFLLVVAIGGAGTIKGGLVAAMILGICDVAGKYYVPQIGSFIIYFLMVALMIAVPRRACTGDAHERDGAAADAASHRAADRPLARARDRVLAAAASRRSSSFPSYRVLGSQILITGLFAVSLDLILGYAGIVSLGHAAFFGIGAYAAGLLAVHGWGEPLSGLVVAGAAGALVGFATSFLVVRGSDLARLMVTLGIGLMLFEAANQAAVDHRRRRRPVRRDDVASSSASSAFDLDRQHRLSLQPRRAVRRCSSSRAASCSSPFGLSLRGIRENVRADAGDRRAGARAG